MRSSEYLMKRCYYVIQDKKVQEGRSEKERREKRNTASRDIYQTEREGPSVYFTWYYLHFGYIRYYSFSK